jgi:hypothetical protein
MAAKKSDKLEVAFTHSNDTAGTRRYKEDQEDKAKQVVGSLYLKKKAAEKLGNPDEITVTIEAS